ncbi:reverse transcriptase domain-containing protein [Tanacetum coccineum]
MRQGYYWLTMHEDAKKEIQKYDSCQIHSAVPKLPKTFMTSIMAPWTFYQWCMDILRTLHQAAGRVKFVIVAIDYFTKWIEAKPLARITGKEMNIVVAHPQANRLVEKANKSLMEGIKTRLGRERAGWVDELPNVLWAHRTSIKTSNGETPFSLTYGSEAVIPTEIVGRHPRGKIQNKVGAVLEQEGPPTNFKPGEFVFRKNEANRVEYQGKWDHLEGPKKVVEQIINGLTNTNNERQLRLPATMWHCN